MEKIFQKDMSSKELISQIYKEHKQFNIKKPNNLIIKWAEEVNSFPKFKKMQTPMKRGTVIREMQIRTTIRYHLTAVGRAIIKKHK